MTKFMINKRTDAWKTDINLLILQLPAEWPSLWMAARLEVNLFWYRPYYFWCLNEAVLMLRRCIYMTKAERSVSKQGHLQPCSLGIWCYTSFKQNHELLILDYVLRTFIYSCVLKNGDLMFSGVVNGTNLNLIVKNQSRVRTVIFPSTRLLQIYPS